MFKFTFNKELVYVYVHLLKMELGSVPFPSSCKRISYGICHELDILILTLHYSELVLPDSYSDKQLLRMHNNIIY